MFAKPRPKKSILPFPSKKRKNSSAVEEVTFDNDARQEFLTGFHKRKQQRIKHAQDVAAKRARQEKLDTRKQIRDDRKRELEEHVENVNRMLRESNAAVDNADKDDEDDEKADEWGGFPDQPDLDIIDQEEEYIEEDRFTTVTVESVSISRDGFATPAELQQQYEEEQDKKKTREEEAAAAEAAKRARPPKQKKKQFRYEPKMDRVIAETRQRAKNKARRSG